MLNRSILPILSDNHPMPEGFRAFPYRYTQQYQTSHSLHYHDYLEIGHCINGSGMQFIGGEIFPFSTNSISIIEKRCVHDSHIIMPNPSVPPSQWQYIFVDLDSLGIRFPLSRSFAIYDKDLAVLFEMMFNELEGKESGWEFVIPSLLEAFLLKGKRLENERLPLKHAYLEDQIASAINTIAQAYNSNISVAQLASECNLSVSHFRQIFKDNLGMSPQEYIINFRLSIAAHMLRTTRKPVLTISEEVGFQTLSSFNRLFKKRYNCSPREMRYIGENTKENKMEGYHKSTAIELTRK